MPLFYANRGDTMARAPDQRVQQAEAMFHDGKKLVEIANELHLPEGTVRRWKSTYKWESERSENNSERSEKKANVRKRKASVRKTNANTQKKRRTFGKKKRKLLLKK